MYNRRSYHSKCRDLYKKGCRFHQGTSHRKFHQAWNYPPINVQEFDDRYEAYVYASGFSKKDFALTVRDNVLIISGEKSGVSDRDGSG